MRGFALFLLLATSLFASGILKNVEIFKRTERVDVLFTFLQSFDGNIVQRGGDGYQTIILKNTPFAGDMKEEIHALGIQEVRIFGKENDLCLIILYSKAPTITASKTTDGFGLRVRLKESEVADTQTQSVQKMETRPVSQSLKDELYTQFLSSSEYMGFIALLFFLLLLLLFVRRLVLKPKSVKKGLTSWLFGSKRRNPSEIEIVQERALDMKNRFITIESHGYRYLILIGAMGNTLIDRYPLAPVLTSHTRAHEGENFNQLLTQKKGQLLDYLESGKRDNHLHLED
ncbi:MAG: hypothetical protein ACTTH5_01860 [Wolinella sp.]